MQFEDDYLFAIDEHGRRIRFTPTERTILKRLLHRPGELVSRGRLLDAIVGGNEAATDRSIDFAVNRLRRKLGDSARKPRFIDTHYGEGYRWLTPMPAASTARAFIVIGPIRGVADDGWRKAASEFARNLKVGLTLRTRKDQPIVIDEACPPASAFRKNLPRFSIELDFVFVETNGLHCAITLREFASARVLHVRRESVADYSGDKAEQLSDALIGALWQALLDTPSPYVVPTEEPLPLRIHDATIQLVGEGSWSETEARLRVMHAAEKSHRLAVLLATAIHSRGMTGGPHAMVQADMRASDLDEIERLVVPAVVEMQDDPFMALATAKLLYFVKRGHDRLAISVAEGAFERTTAFASAYAVMGQLRLCEGDLDEAGRLIQGGLALAKPESYFAIYMRVMACIAAYASGQPAWARQATLDYAQHHPQTYALTRLLFVAPGDPASDDLATRALSALDKNAGTAILNFIDFYYGRPCRIPAYRKNLSSGIVPLLVQRFGDDVVPAQMRTLWNDRYGLGTA